MKLFCVVLALTFVVYAQAFTPEVKEKLHNVRDECVKETGAPADVVKQIEAAQYTGTGEELNCYAKCFYLKVGFMNDKGEIQTNVMKAMLKDEKEKDKLEDVVDKCNEKLDADPCKAALHSMNCWEQNYNKIVKQN